MIWMQRRKEGADKGGQARIGLSLRSWRNNRVGTFLDRGENLSFNRGNFF